MTYEVANCVFADNIAQIVFAHYAGLPRTGKPVAGTEWTHLSAILRSDLIGSEKSLQVVSLATGSKCIGRNSMSPDGTVVNDSHAEVLARRCFLRYLYHQILELQNGRPSDVLDERTCNVGEVSAPKYALKRGVRFHFFTSHVPCGDAAICPKLNKTFCDSSDVVNARNKREFSHESMRSGKRKKVDDGEQWTSVLPTMDSELCDKVDDMSPIGYNIVRDYVGDVIKESESDDLETVANDVHRTGAKCLSTDARQDGKGCGVDYHTVGAVRTKPGRGDPTLSVSCSDKMARWTAVGLQGALLSLLIEEPISVSSVVVGGGGPYSQQSMHRAIVTRSATHQPPTILRSSKVFEMSRYSPSNLAANRPTSGALMWTDVKDRLLEVAVQGRRQGTTKKSKDKGALTICKRELFKMFISCTGNTFANCTYGHVKNMATQYQCAWSLVKHSFGSWTKKPVDLSQFYLDCKELL